MTKAAYLFAIGSLIAVGAGMLVMAQAGLPASLWCRNGVA